MNEIHIKTLESILNHWKRLYTERICEEQEGKETIEALQAAIEALQTEQKVGKWTHMRTDIYECSICGHIHTSFELNKCDAKFCSICGAKMEEGE